MLSYIAVPDTAVPTTWPLTVRTVGAAALVDPHTKASRDFSSGDLWFLFPSPVAGTSVALRLCTADGDGDCEMEIQEPACKHARPC